MYDLSILIPSRNEMFLARTIEDILSNIEGDTEIIVVLDGQWADPPIPQHERVTVVYLPVSIGQRAATNLAASLSTSKYVMKCDAHCSFGKGFDRILMEDMQDEWTTVPKMYNLHAFDWVCPNAHRRYQGPSGPCKECGAPTEKDVLWHAKTSPETTAMRFDTDLKFQYWSDYKKKQSGDLVESMSLLGACWMLTREKYWELNISDEAHGRWGQQGTEVSCKTWLSGGKVIVNKKTWFAHMFRTQGGDFGFPYPLSGSQVDQARKYSKNLWIGNKWAKAKYPLEWLIKKFKPPGWPVEVSKSIIYYTDNELEPRLLALCQKYILKANLPIVSVSLKPLDFGTNIVLPLPRGHLTMFKQILAALEASTADIIFFCEHDCLYDISHFDFTPPKDNVYYYNENVWRVRDSDGHAIHYDAKQSNMLCGYRDFLITHYKERIRRVEAEGYSNKMGYEPGTHRRPERIDDFGAQGYKSRVPSLDIRHGKNLTQSRWSLDQFRNKPKDWIESQLIPGWGEYKSIK